MNWDRRAEQAMKKKKHDEEIRKIAVVSVGIFCCHVWIAFCMGLAQLAEVAASLA